MPELMEVKIPDIGDYKDVPVIEVFVKPGDQVSAEDSLITVESDKATMEVPSPAAGVIKELRVKVGDKVSEGSPVLLLEPTEPRGEEKKAPAAAPTPVEASASAASAAANAPAPEKAPAARSASPALSGSSPSAREHESRAPFIPESPRAAVTERGGVSHASPSVRRLARELGVDLSRVTGSGPKERILKEDVQAYVKRELARPHGESGTGVSITPAQPVDFSKFGPITTQPLSRIKKISGSALHRNWVTIPHVTQHDESDITELEAFRKSQADDAKGRGIRLTLLTFLMKAAVVALRRFPEFNASLAPDGENLILKQYFHIGVAVDTPNGLVVPVIRDVDTKGLFDLAHELGATSERVRAGKIAPADLQGGCFSISSLGGIGGVLFTPIINAPEVAILGVSKAAMKPIWNGKEFVPRLMLPLSLSYDHRVIDGALGARFITFFSALLADIRKLLL